MDWIPDGNALHGRVAVTPGWLRSEIMLDNWSVSEENWRTALDPDRGGDLPTAPAGWGWHSGETVRLAFVSVHRVESDKITLWKDYSDFNTLLSQAPQSFTDGFASADTSWVFDATDLV